MRHGLWLAGDRITLRARELAAYLDQHARTAQRAGDLWHLLVSGAPGDQVAWLLLGKAIKAVERDADADTAYARVIEMGGYVFSGSC